MEDAVKRFHAERGDKFVTACEDICKLLPEPGLETRIPHFPAITAGFEEAFLRADGTHEEYLAAGKVMEQIVRICTVMSTVLFQKYYWHDMASAILLCLYSARSLTQQRKMLNFLLTLCTSAGTAIDSYLDVITYVIGSIASDSDDTVAEIDAPYVAELLRRSLESVGERFVVQQEPFGALVILLLRSPGVKYKIWALRWVIDSWDTVLKSTDIGIILKGVLNISRCDSDELEQIILEIVGTAIQKLHTPIHFSAALQISQILLELCTSPREHISSVAHDGLNSLVEIHDQKAAVTKAITGLASGEAGPPEASLPQFISTLEHTSLGAVVMTETLRTWLHVLAARQTYTKEIDEQTRELISSVRAKYPESYEGTIVHFASAKDCAAARPEIISFEFLKTLLPVSALLPQSVLDKALQQRGKLGMLSLYVCMTAIVRDVIFDTTIEADGDDDGEAADWEAVSTCLEWEITITKHMNNVESPTEKSLICQFLFECAGLPAHRGTDLEWMPAIVDWLEAEVSLSEDEKNAIVETSHGVWHDMERVFGMEMPREILKSIAAPGLVQALETRLDYVEAMTPFRGVSESVMRLVAEITRQGHGMLSPSLHPLCERLGRVSWTLLEAPHSVMSDAAFIFMVLAEQNPAIAKQVLYANILSRDPDDRLHALIRCRNYWRERKLLGRQYRALYVPRAPPAAFRPLNVGTPAVDIPATALMKPPKFASVAAAMPDTLATLQNDDEDEDPLRPKRSRLMSIAVRTERKRKQRKDRGLGSRLMLDLPTMMSCPFLPMMQLLAGDTSMSYIYARRALEQCTVEDVRLVFRILLDQLGYQALPNQVELLTRLRLTQRHFSDIPPHYAYTVFNQLLGLIMSQRQDARENVDVIMALTLPILSRVVSRVVGFTLTALKEQRGDLVFPYEGIRGTVTSAAAAYENSELHKNYFSIGPLKAEFARQIALYYPKEAILLTESISDILAATLSSACRSANEVDIAGGVGSCVRAWLSLVSAMIADLPENIAPVIVPHFAATLSVAVSAAPADSEVIFRVLAICLDLSRHFDAFFGQVGYGYIIPIVASLYQMRVDTCDTQVKIALEYAWTQFHSLHKETFIMQLILAISRMKFDHHAAYYLSTAPNVKICENVEDWCVTVMADNDDVDILDTAIKLVVSVCAYSPGSRLAIGMMEWLRLIVPGIVKSGDEESASFLNDALQLLILAFETPLRSVGVVVGSITLPADSLEALLRLSAEFLGAGGRLQLSHFNVLRDTVRSLLDSGGGEWKRRMGALLDFFVNGLVPVIKVEGMSDCVASVVKIMMDSIVSDPTAVHTIPLVATFQAILHRYNKRMVPIMASVILDPLFTICRNARGTPHLRSLLLDLAADLIAVTDMELPLANVKGPEDAVKQLRGVLVPLVRRIGPKNITQRFVPSTDTLWYIMLAVIYTLRFPEAHTLGLIAIKIMALREHESLGSKWAIVSAALRSSFIATLKGAAADTQTSKTTEEVLGFLEFLTINQVGPLVSLKPSLYGELSRLANSNASAAEHTKKVLDGLLNTRYTAIGHYTASLKALDDEMSLNGVDV